MSEPGNVAPNGFAVEAAGRIVEVGSGRVRDSGEVVDHGPGILMPSLVNAHTHLELSALKGKLDCEDDFESWVRELLRLRGMMSSEELLKAAEAELQRFPEEGCRVVGEISTLGITWNLVQRFSLYGVWFQEILGNDASETDSRPEAGKIPVSLAGHAPHTTSPSLLQKAKDVARSRGLPFSIHLGESEAEVAFLANGTGAWADFLAERGVDFSGWGLSGCSPVRYLEQLGVLDDRTIAVHLLHADWRDLEILARHQVNVCLCCRSNEALHNRLPDIDAMEKAGLNICLGTDSLASTASLSMWDEMQFVANRYPLLRPEAILKMAIGNGRKALGGVDISAGMVYAPVSGAKNEREVLSALVYGETDGLCTPMGI